MSRKGGLGRGFESLIPTDVLDEAFDPTALTDERISELRHVAVDVIAADPDQPRRHFDDEALHELTESIRVHGILQPIVVTPHEGGFQIVAGERRWRAAKRAELQKVPVIVRTLNNQHKLELSLIENLQRKDLNPLEAATAYVKLRTQFNMTNEEIGQRLGGRSKSAISNATRLLQLPHEAKEALVSKQISEGHARQILALEDEKAQAQLLDFILKEGWSVRKAEQYVLGFKKGETKPVATKQAVKHTQNETPLTKALQKRLSMPVTYKTTAHGGQIIIKFKDDTDLERIQNLLN